MSFRGVKLFLYLLSVSRVIICAVVVDFWVGFQIMFFFRVIGVQGLILVCVGFVVYCCLFLMIKDKMLNLYFYVMVFFFFWVLKRAILIGTDGFVERKSVWMLRK